MVDMWDLSIQLVTADGAGWGFTYTVGDVFFVFLDSGCFSFCSAYVAHYMAASKKQFTVYFTNACMTFPASELARFEHFLQHVRTARPVL